MRSSNPVFSRGFRDNGYAGFGTGPQAGTAPQGNPYATGPYAEPTNPYASNPYATGGPGLTQGAPAQPGVVTMDDVVMRSAMTIGLVIVGAVIGWATNLPIGVAFVAGIVAAGLGIVQQFKAKPSPALILGYAVSQGLALGIISKLYNHFVDGAPVQAVLGTIAVSVGTLIAYKTGVVRVNNRFYRVVTAAGIGFMLLMLANLLFAAIGGGDGLGLRSGPLGIGIGVIGVLLGAAYLAMNFKEIEDGIAYGAPRESSWIMAFGLTMSLVWIYMEMLRLVSILQGDD
ncbi:Bax inhibitor-1/YccA family protein [Streptomyces sp. UNOC14_S4]|uniref:Bax inhibitor-1/YccA family protein n=1 Tax=Streptomyces sp. UNOC14_S4 TaxID=2872340 RepID=UPI001E3B70C3|nr:Bax inhibitor-1/YccA family protein [Streptomyces sp. UNOC14_S4]MCC3770991.1 Bax inhibitor-1/YccA family protein [Streptomyces sp. UNOC14_S4]